MANALEVAKLLLDINAVAINLQSPFRYSSGLLSPVYCDNRLLISYPKQRTQIIDAFLTAIEHHAVNFDVIAGTATAGIPHAAWIAEKLNKPMVYVRSGAKKHGKSKQIEGHLEPGSTVIVIEDHISTGGSALHASQCLRDAGAQVEHCFAISNYGFESTDQAFNGANVQAHCLTDFQHILKAASENGNISETELKLASQWNKAPAEWETLYNTHAAQ